MLTKRHNYIVPDETQDGQTIIYADSDNDAMCADCCNIHNLVPFDVIIVTGDESEPYECAYCGEAYPEVLEEADFIYYTHWDHDRYYLTVRCKECGEDVHVWEDDDAKDFVEDNCALDWRKWHQPIWEYLNDNNLLHYH